MKKQRHLLKSFRSFLITLMLAIVFFQVKAQDTGIKISDQANFIISENTYFKVPGNITLGEGTSGKLVMNGTSISSTGNLTVNAGSDFDIKNGTLTFAGTSFNSLSTVSYKGDGQNVENWDYGHLIMNGTGLMSVTGDAAKPTTCNTLTINNTGNTFVVPENKAITISNALTNNIPENGIIINSSSTGDGSMISNSADVNATVNRYITGERWHYLSSPIDAAPLSLFNTNNFMCYDASIEWGGLGNYDPWKSYTASNLNNVEAYAYYYYEDTIAFKGSMNVNNYAYTLHKSSTGTADYQGWNLIGNPYTSILNWDEAVADGAVPVGAENAIYFFDDETQSGEQSNYRYYVPSTGGTYGAGTADATGDIPLGQGFFIKTNTDNVILNLKKDYRMHAIQEFYKSTVDPYIKLTISNAYSDETIIRVIDESSSFFDSEFDARKLFPFSNSIPQIYCIDSNNSLTAINTIPEINKDTEIRLGFKAEEGTYTFSIKDLNFYEFPVYLVDNYLNETTDLSNGDYTFKYEGENVNKELNIRFKLVFKTGSSAINELNSFISIYPNPTSDFIKLHNKSNSEFESIAIHSSDGKICYNNHQAEYTETIDLSSFTSGIYFIKIQMTDGTICYNRIIVRK